MTISSLPTSSSKNRAPWLHKLYTLSCYWMFVQIALFLPMDLFIMAVGAEPYYLMAHMHIYLASVAASLLVWGSLHQYCWSKSSRMLDQMSVTCIVIGAGLLTVLLWLTPVRRLICLAA